METQSHFSSQPEATDRAVVLVVDDEMGPRESLRMILSPNHQVITASSGNEALEVLRGSEVDLVTVDLNMPGIKGDELVDIIRTELPQVEIIIITGFGTLETAVSGIRRGVCDFLAKPFDVVQVNASVSRAIQRRRSRKRLVRFLEGIGAVVGRNRSSDDILNELEGNRDLQNRLQALLEEPALHNSQPGSPDIAPKTIEFLELLSETIENREPGMRGHARRVAFYVQLLSERLCLGKTAQQHARVAAFLHDLGKLGLPHDVLPVGAQLNEAQRSAIEQHPAIAERLLRPLDLPSAIHSAMRHHHERWDGKGYPDGQRGEEIPLFARMVAVADAFDAMVSDQSYCPARSRNEALAELQREAGKQFDPSQVAAFHAVAGIRYQDDEEPIVELNADDLADSLAMEVNQ